MYDKNIFTQKDPIADAISQIAEADYKAKMEELKGKQAVLDKNKNNKLDADDFKILRGEKKAVKEEQQDESTNPFSKDYKSQIPTKPGEKAGFDSKKISTGTVYSKKHKPEPAEKEVKEETEQVDEASYSAKAARAGKDIGKPGKMFKKIAKGAAARYGSMARGKKVAGAVLAKLRKEETDYEPLLIDQITEDTMSAIEQLDELKKATVKSYIAKKMDKIYSAKKAPGKKKAKKDTESLQRAHERAVGNKPTSEEVEIDEVYDVEHMKYIHTKEGNKHFGDGHSTMMKHIGDDFQKMNARIHASGVFKQNPHKKGTKEHKAWHHGADAARDEHIGSLDEGVEQIEENFKPGDFVKDVVHGHIHRVHKVEGNNLVVNRHQGKDSYGTFTNLHKTKARKVETPTNEEVEQIDERTLTPGETSEKERIVKGMKKNLAGFRKRYGEKAKSVMYATATKAAKKD